MAEASPQPETSTAGTRRSPSPPPNCAICLGNCINKCFSDSCMHQFCFKCLLEWSKVKAVCPLCKQPFNSIIHNVKSNNEYDEHFIATEPNNSQEVAFRDLIEPAYDLLVTPASRHFQFRTTFTVDPRGELAIQQLLSSHPLTSNSFHLSLPSVPNYNVQRTHLRRFQHDTNFRRYIYDEDMWVHALPDITGRFRDVSPQYFRENPAARNRLVPWLNRELNALLFENTQHVMHVCDQILSQLDRHHLTSRYFNQLIEEYLGSRTDHFIHEFYNFMRSPYDMIGYDRVVSYSHALRVRIDSSDEEDEDSDVVIVGTQPVDPVVIEIESDSSRESDVIIREPTPPVVVDLVDTESEQEKPLLPLKIRLKRKRQNRERRSRRARERSSSESNSSTSSTTSSERSSHARSRKRYQKQKYYIVKNTDSDSDSENQSLNKLKKEWEDRKRKKAKKSKRKQKSKSVRTSQHRYSDENESRTSSTPQRHHPDKNRSSKFVETSACSFENNRESTSQERNFDIKDTHEPRDVATNDMGGDAVSVIYKCENNVQSDQSASYTPPPRDNFIFSQASLLDYVTHSNGSINKSDDVYKSEVRDRTILNNKLDILDYAGPSNTRLGLHCNNWYSRPVVLNSDDDSD